ncbi:MAG: hypothetical protein NTV14_01220 [Coprothermobacterota bacterium]|nr:hypothetical protein [Coprothermobacterota bacterium]
MEDSVREPLALERVGVRMRRLLAAWKKLRASLEAWDRRHFELEREVLDEGLLSLAANWPVLRVELEERIQASRRSLEDPLYPQLLEESLRKAGVPLAGAFPNFEFPPFKLHVSLAEEQCILSMGRRRENTSAMNPASVAGWVASRYRKVAGRPIQATRLCQELREAYEYANRLHYAAREVLWGKPVPLATLCTLFTLRREAKRDYPLQLFLYDLGRLKETFPLELQGYRFEFGFTRNQGRSYDLVDSQGRVSHISSLSIHAPEEDHANDPQG